MKIRYLFTILLILTSCVGVSAAAKIDKSNGVFYVSPKGNDLNDGSTPEKPFETLAKAQIAMQNSTANKRITYVMGGVYNLKAPLSLTPKDNGQSWLGYPGETPILDGNNQAKRAIMINGYDITIRWLTIQNFRNIGIFAHHSSNILIDSNTIKNINSDGWIQGGIVTKHSFKDSTISHNHIENSRYAGIMSETYIGDDISNLLIDSNTVYNACTHVNDCGAIYANDRGHESKNIVIKNNIIRNYGNKNTPWAKAIYLDDQLSNATVINNIASGSGGKWIIQVHGGDHNLIKNNIFDISGSETLGLSQSAAKGAINYGMEGNIFKCNIIYSSLALPSKLWTYAKTDKAPDVSSNLYWSASGRMPNANDNIDKNPNFSDPGFINPSKGDYNFTNTAGKLNFCSDFRRIDTKQVGPLPNTKMKMLQD